jgi:hypothetical protein
MSKYEKKDGDFVLFKNEKEEGSNKPDYTGEVLIKGVTYRIGGWIKEGQKGKFIAGSAKEKTNG